MSSPGNYSLGTAHGSIVIDYDDKGSKTAQEDFDKTGEKADGLGAKFRILRDSIRDFSRNAVSDLTAFNAAASLLVGATAIVFDLTRQAGGLTGGFLAARGAINIISSLGLALGLLPQGTQNFPTLIKNVIRVAGAISLLKASSGILANVAAKSKNFASFAPGIKSFGDSIFRLSAPVRTVANLAIRIGGLLAGIRIVTALAKAFVILSGSISLIAGLAFILGGIGQALIQLSGVLGLIPGLALAAGAAIATLAIGLNGIKDAFKALDTTKTAKLFDDSARAAKEGARAIVDASKAIDQAKKDQIKTANSGRQQIVSAAKAVKEAEVDAAKAIIDAQKQIEDAKKSLIRIIADTAREQEQANQRVEQAQRRLTASNEDSAASVESASKRVISAKRAETQAQKDLNRLQQEQLDLLDELQERTGDLALDRREAENALKRALKQQLITNHDLAASEEQKEDAKISVLRAQDRLNDIEKDQGKNASALIKAQSEVINGSEAIIDARQRVVEANEDIKQSEKDLLRAQQEAITAQIDARKDLSDAVRDAALLQEESSERIARAENEVIEARNNVARITEESNDRVISANERLIETQQEVAEANENASNRVIEAQENLADTQERVASASAAASSALTDQLKPFNELSPSAKALLLQLKGLEGQWKQLRNTVQEVLFKGITKDVDELVRIYFPILSAGLSEIASEFNFAGKEFSRFLQSPKSIGQITEALGLTKTIIHNLVLAIEPLLRAFFDIATVGLQALIDLTGGAEATSNKFADFISRVKEDGSLRVWIDGGIQGVKDLIVTVGNLFGIFNALFAGLSGNENASFLTFLREGSSSLKEFLSSAEQQENLRQIGEVVGGIVNNSLRILNALIEELGPVLSDLMPFIISLGSAFTDSLILVLKIVTPLLQLFADILSFIGPSVAAQLGLLLALGLSFKIFSAAIAFTLPFLSIFATQLGTLDKVIRGLAFVMLHPAQAWTKAVKIIKIGFAVLRAAFLTNPFGIIALAVLALAYIIYKNWDSIVEFLGKAWEFIKNIFKNPGEFFSGLGRDIVDGFIKGLEDIVKVAKLIGDWLHKYIVQPIKNFFGISSPSTLMAEFGTNIIQGLIDGIIFLIVKIPQIFKDAFYKILEVVFGWDRDTVDALIRARDNIIRNVSDAIWGAVQAVWRIGGDFVRAVGDFIGGALRFFWDLPGNIYNAIRNINLYNIGRDIIIGLWNGIASLGQWLWDRVLDFARSFIPGPIARALGISSPSKVGFKLGQEVPRGIAGGIDDTASEVGKSSMSMVEQVTDSLSGISIPKIKIDPFEIIKSDMIQMPDILTRLQNLVDQAANDFKPITIEPFKIDDNLKELATSAAEIASPQASLGNRVNIDAVSERPISTIRNQDFGDDDKPGNILIENMHLHVQGALDRTKPVEFRRTMIEIRDGLRDVERSRR